MVDHSHILFLRSILHAIICGASIVITCMITIYFDRFESCDVSPAYSCEPNNSIRLTILYGLVIELYLKPADNPSILESRAWYFLIVGKVLLAQIVVAFPLKALDFLCVDAKDEVKIDRLFRYDTISRRINGTYDFEYCIDPRSPPRCTAVSRRAWTMPELILTVIITEFVVFLTVYLIDRWESRRQHPHRRRSNLFETRGTHRASIWWHRRIDSDGDWHDHDELIEYMRDSRSDSARSAYFTTIVPVIDLNSSTTSNMNNIDRLIYSMIIFDCNECDADNGMYLLIVSEFRRQYRLVKLSSTVPFYDPDGGGTAATTYVQDGLAMCVYGREGDENGKFLLYNIKDDWKREIDAFVTVQSGSWFWCLSDDGRDMGRAIRKDATYVRMIHCHDPIDRINVGFAFRQCIVEIPRDVDGAIEIKQLQEITYGSNWRFAERYRLIRSSRGQIGAIIELINPNTAVDEVGGETTKWTTCVVYSPVTRRLTATGDYEKYFLEFDPGLRTYIDRNFDEYGSWLINSFNRSERFKLMFMCPQHLTDTRAIDLLHDGSIWNIDFEPRSLKWQSLRKLFDSFQFDVCRATDWKCMTGVDLEEHLLD